MTDLFGNNDVKVTLEQPIRTLGFYEPFCSLMAHNKIETRWVKSGKKPPFILGKYLLYTTKEPAGERMNAWCSQEDLLLIKKTLPAEIELLNGYALLTGELYKVCPLTPQDLSYIKYYGTKIFSDKEGKQVLKTQWALHFKNIQRIKPFEWKFGKQGTGFVPDSELKKIIHI